MKNKNLLNLALFSSLISIFLHAYLTLQHLKLTYHMSNGDSICNINSVFNCDAVAASMYSTLFGTPVALFGLTANLALLCIFIVQKFRLSNMPEQVSKLSFFFSGLIAITSVLMGIISIVFLKSYCIFCIVLYLLSFITVYSAAKNLDQGPLHNIFDTIKKLFKSGDHGLSSYLVIMAGAPLLSMFLNSMVHDQLAKGFDQMIKQSIQEWATSPSKDIPTENGLVMGASAEQAKMTIIEFADFQCGHCKMASPVLHAFTLANQDVRLIFMHFPLDGECNPAIPPDRVSGSCIFARAVFCANKMNKGWDAHQYLFENQGVIKPSNLSPLLEHLHANSVDFNSCLESSEARDAVTRQALIGRSIDVQGTPSVFINYKLSKGGALLQSLQEIHSNINK